MNANNEDPQVMRLTGRRLLVCKKSTHQQFGAEDIKRLTGGPISASLASYCEKILKRLLSGVRKFQKRGSGPTADTKLIGMPFQYRPAFSKHVVETKVIDVHHEVSGTGVKRTILTMEDGSELDASTCYFPLSAMDSDKD